MTFFLFLNGTFGLVGKAYAENLRLDKIEVIGAAEEFRDPIQNLVGLLPGDPIEQPKIIRATELIKEYYQAEGFTAAKIEADIVLQGKLNVLAIKVQEGPAIHIEDIQVRLLEKTSPEIHARIQAALGFEAGERLSKENLANLKRNLESTLSALDYVDAKVTDVRTEASPTKKSDHLRLLFYLNLGQRVVFSFRGNNLFSRSEILGWIKEQQALGLGNDYSETIKSLLLNKYKDLGYLYTKIQIYPFESQGSEPRKLLFEIDEGARVRIKNFIFDGQEQFTPEELKEFLMNGASDRVKNGFFNLKQVEDAATGMMEEVRKRGYLSAKLLAVRAENTANPSEMNIKIFLVEGQQTKISSIQISGNTLFTEEQIRKWIEISENQPMSLVALERAVGRIKQEYRNLGRLKFKILNEDNKTLVTYTEKNLQASLDFQLSEGPEITLSQVRIDGLRKTRENVVLREVQLDSGQPIDERKILETEERLRRLGVFSQVSLELVEEDKPLERSLRIRVQEAVPGTVGTGLGFRNDLGLRLFGEVSYNNLWGRNHTWTLNLSGNHRIENFKFAEFQAVMSYAWPWAFLGETMLRPSLSYERRQYIQFNEESFGFSTSLERRLVKALHLFGSLTYSLEQIRQYDARLEIDNQQIRIGSFSPALKVDFRDNPLSPRSGFFALTSYEYANPQLGSQASPFPVSFARYQFRSDFYVNAIPRVVFYFSARGGWAKNLEKGDDDRLSVPLIKQFSLGGINSLRGFNLQEVNVQDQVVRDYMTFVNYRSQMDIFLTQSLSIGPFLDAGNLKINDFSLGTLRYGTGVGLRYATPVGPVNFDWGFKLHPTGAEDVNVFYFSLGVI